MRPLVPHPPGIGGLPHALGKTGAAAHLSGTPALRSWSESRLNPFRNAVLSSRVHVMAALPAIANGNAVSIIEAGTLLVCTELWAKADVLLSASERETPT